MSGYIPILMMASAAAGLGLILYGLFKILGPYKPNAEKLSTYESGMTPVKTARERFSIKYYMVAVLFILFDIEIVFLYPWAVNFKALGLFGYIEMVLFIVILLIGYFYILKKGALEWD